jgi:hypothetical protein
MWFNSTTNQIKYWNGATALTVSNTAGSISLLNGLTANSQDFTVGSAGTDFAISSAGSTHTFNIPTSNGVVTRGLLSSADWTTFNNKLATTTSFSGDVSGTYNSINVAKLQNQTLTLGAQTAGNYLRNTGSAWVNSNLLSADITTSLGFTPSSSSLNSANIFVGNASNIATGVALSGDATITNAGVMTITNNAITNAKINDVNWSKVTGTPTTIAGYAITNAITNLGVGATSNVNSFQAGTFAARPAFGTAGRMYVATDTQEIYRDTGTAWTKVGSANGAGGTVTTVGVAPPLSVINPTTTPIISMNEADGTASGGIDTDGYLSAANFNLFYNKLDATTTISGDVSGTFNTTSVNKIKGKTVSPAAYATNQYLRYDGTNWVNSLLVSSDITTSIGILPVVNGGTGANSLGSGNLLVGGGTAPATSLAAGAVGNVIYGSGVASWASGTPDTAGLVDKSSKIGRAHV